MADMMTFPDTVEEFMEEYKLVDTEQVYTNGTELVPIFRMEQWFEHEKAQLSQEGTTSDLISRTETVEHLRRVLDATVPITDYDEGYVDGVEFGVSTVSTMPPAQPERQKGEWIDYTEDGLEPTDEQKSCEYCHEDSDGYTRPIEKNCHAYIGFGMNGWELNLKAKGWHGSAKIKYCPICGRRLTHE